jgi:hypothetical protein
MTKGWQQRSLRALAGGLVAYLAAMVVASVTLSGLTRLSLGAMGWEEPEIRAFFAAQFASYPQAVLAALPGVLAAGAAGYTAATMATDLEYWHALGVSLLAALVFTAPVIGRLPLGYTLMTLGSSLAVSLFGASFPKARNRTQRAGS